MTSAGETATSDTPSQLRRTVCLPNTAVLERILSERGPFADDEEEVECKVRIFLSIVYSA